MRKKDEAMKNEKLLWELIAAPFSFEFIYLHLTVYLWNENLQSGWTEERSSNLKKKLLLEDKFN